MPGMDGTGPMGQGPLTGGGFGYCTGARPYYGRGLVYGAGRGGRPWGGGRGFAYGGAWRRAGYYNPQFGGGYYSPAPQETWGSESEFLKAQAEDLRAELNAIEERLAGLEKSTPEE
ncbi:MAG: DUF5320 domain-containing protein [Deltaproteobacteria bacterium]|nr:DUF5320 domain-containing protein [Deltaproteobacteria bacterium]MBW2085940.1 DUF5320 domain-containing protein [Deltaproteobacteria bacterium]